MIEVNVTGILCGILVMAFTLLGLAKLADRLDLTINKNAVADKCGGGQQCNAETTNKRMRARASVQTVVEGTPDDRRRREATTKA
jgi:hypothetical protein